MHKYLTSVGLSEYINDEEIERLLDDLTAENIDKLICMDDEFDHAVSELCLKMGKNIGVYVRGYITESGRFRRLGYYPFLASEDITATAETYPEMSADGINAYSAIVDPRLVMDVFFQVEGFISYYNDTVDVYKLVEENDELTTESDIFLSGLCSFGKVLLPVEKTKEDVLVEKIKRKKHLEAIESAKSGDSRELEGITLGEINKLALAVNRFKSEDVYSVIDSNFMPKGFESNEFLVLGDIVGVEEVENIYTKESIYDLKISFNDFIIHVGVNEKDLQGEPKVGRRFKGIVWLTGRIKYHPENLKQ